MKEKLFITFLFLIILFSACVNYIVGTHYNNRIYDELSTIPYKRVALVLGTAKLFEGRPNLYYRARLKAAHMLYRSGKVDKIVVSGDSSKNGYDEPSDMAADLVTMGVKKDDIYLDYAGLRTLDSVVRAKEVFSLNDFVIVSQRSHCQRALFIAQARSIDAIAFTARDISHPGKFKMQIREFLARVKAGIDIWIINKSPKFLGKKILVQ